jgi:autotransporter-associated beta strand protein
VTFDDTAVHKNVVISGDVSPSRITVDTDVGYEIGGSGDIKGIGSLVKRGTGILTIGNDANAYTGGTVIEVGGIEATHVNALGGASAVVTMKDSTTLSVPTGFASKIVVDLNASVTVTLPVGDTTLSSPIEGTGNVTVAGTGRRTFTATASTFDGTMTVAEAFTFNGANANWANADVVSTASTADRVFSGSGTMKFSSVTVGGTGKLLVNGSTNLDVAKISALDTLTFEGGGKLISSTGAVRFDVASGKTVTWNNNTFVNSASTKLVKEGEGTLTVTNFNSGDQSRNIEVLGGTLRATTNSTKGYGRDYLIQGSSATDIATFTVALAANYSGGFFSQLQGDEAGGRNATMTMQYGKLYFESGVCHGLPNAITMRSSTIEFATGRLDNWLYQIASLPMTFVVERPSDMTTGVAVSYLKTTHSTADTEGIHLTNRNGTTQFDIRENAKLVVEAILTGETGSPGSNGNLIKNGAGEMELAAANKHTGTTTINGGTLSIVGNNNSATGAYTVAAGATLRLAGAGTISGTPTVSLGSGASLIFDKLTAMTFANTLNGSGVTLYKRGPGEVHVSGTVSSLTGVLIVEGGSLRFTNVPTVTRLELSSGAMVNVGTKTLGLTGSNVQSFAGHPQQSSGFSGNDITGSLQLASTHRLVVGSPDSADNLRLSGGLSLNNNTLQMDISASGVGDLIVLGGEFSATGTTTLKLSQGAPIVLPEGTYDLVNFGSLGAGTSASNFTVQGIVSSPSLRADAVLDPVGKTLSIVVARTGLLYHWNSATGDPGNRWDLTTNAWEIDNGNTQIQGHYDQLGIAVFDGRGDPMVQIREGVEALETDITAGNYTFTNTGTGKITGPGGLTLRETADGLTLTVDGSGALPNDFAGAVRVEGSTLTLTDGGYGKVLIGDRGQPSLIGAGRNADAILLSKGASFLLDGSQPTVTDRSFTIGTGGAKVKILGERVTFGNSAAALAQVGTGERTLTLGGAAGTEGVLKLRLEDGGVATGNAPFSLKKEGAGTWWLANSGNSFTGGVEIEDGELALSLQGTTGHGAVTLSGGVLSNRSANNSVLGENPTIGGGIILKTVASADSTILTQTGGTLTLQGTVSNDTPGRLVKKGPGTLVLKAASPAFSGGLYVQEGIARVEAQAALGTGLTEVGAGTKLLLGVDKVTTNHLSGTGTVKADVYGSAVTLFINEQAGVSNVFSGALQDSGTSRLGVTKTGLGTLEINGIQNDYTGPTSVEAGTLVVSTTAAFPNTSGFVVASGGTLEIQGIALGKAVTLSGTGHASKGALYDSVGGAVAPQLVLAASATVLTAGTTTLTGVSGTGTLTLATEAANGAWVVTGSGTPVVTGVNLKVASGTTLELQSSETLATTTGLELVIGSTLSLAGGISQTLSALDGVGRVAGTGSLNLSVSGPSVFSGTLEDGVSLGVTGTGSISFANAAGNTTTGGIRIFGGGTLKLDVPLTDASGVTNDALGSLGASPSSVRIENGTLRSTANTRSSTARTFTLGGSSSAFVSDGDGGFQFTSGSSFDFAGGTSAHALTLGGSSVGTGASASRVDAVLADPIGGTLSVVKAGTGTWYFGAANTFSGSLSVEGGTLVLETAASMPVGVSLNLGSVSGASGVLQLGTATTGPVSLRLGSLTVTGPGADNRIVNGSSGYSDLGVSVATGQTVTYAGALGLPGVATANRIHFSKTGPGTLVFESTSQTSLRYAYTGNTTVEEGVLKLRGTLNIAGQEVVVWPGARLDSTEMAGTAGFTVEAGRRLQAGHDGSTVDLAGFFSLNGGTLVVGQGTAASSILTLDGGLSVRTASTLEYTLSANASGAENSLLRTGALRLGNTTRISPVLLNGILAIGEYTLIEYADFNAAGFANIDVSPLILLDPRYTFGVRNDAATGRILLDVGSAGGAGDGLTWRGAPGSSIWSGTDENFIDSNNQLVSYFSGLRVLFDNSAHSFDVTVGNGGVSIGFVTFANDEVHPYTLTSSGLDRVNGTGYLEKRGAGVLTLHGANNYRGTLDTGTGIHSPSTILAGGVLAFDDDGSLGPDAILIYTGTLHPLGTRSLTNNISLPSGAKATFEVDPGASFTLTGTLTGGRSAVLAKTGPGTLVLGRDGAGFQGRLDVSAGAIRLDGGEYFGAVIDLGNAGSLEISDSAGAASHVGDLRGIAGSTVTGTGLLELGGNGMDANFAGTFAGAFSLLKTGVGTLTLIGNNAAHTGDITVSAGRLQYGDGFSGTLGSGSVVVEDGATVVFLLPGTRVALSQDIAGEGTIEKQGVNTLVIDRDNSGFDGLWRVGDGVLEFSGAGTLGSAPAEVTGTLLFTKTGDYTLANSIFGAGTLVKAGDGGTLTYLGAGSPAVHVQAGTFAFGDAVTPLTQVQAMPTSVSGGATLLIAPAAGGSVLLGDISADPAASITKIGSGNAVLTGLVQAEGGIAINDGVLIIGGGAANGAMNVNAPLAIAQNASLAVTRSGETRLAGAITGSGTLTLVGDTAGAGLTVLLSQQNEIAGGISLTRKTVLQVGTSTQAATLGAQPVEVNIGGQATLRFNRTVDGLTGAGLSLVGAGTVEQRGPGSTRFNSDAQNFTGSFLASEGTFVFDAAALPTVTLDAAGAGVLRIESHIPASTAATSIAPTLGAGNGTVLLAAAGSDAVCYEIPGGVAFSGTLAVGEQATLGLIAGTTLDTGLEVRNGGRLVGNGILNGNLHNAVGGIVKPGESPGHIHVAGNFVNEGLLVIDADTSDLSTINYTGTAVITPTGTLRLRMSRALFDVAGTGSRFNILVDDLVDDGKPAVTGNFSTQNIVVEVEGVELGSRALTYSNGAGLTLLLSGSLGEILRTENVPVRSGLNDYVRYLDSFLQDGHNITYTDFVSAILGAGNPGYIGEAVNTSSPGGLAAAVGMSISTAHDDIANLHNHLESLRFSRAFINEPIGTAAYFMASGNFQQNGSAASNPAYDFNAYGATVGFDQSVGDDFIIGINAGYHHGRADIADSGGRITQENARLNAYASLMVNNHLYVDASVFAGYSGYEVKRSVKRLAIAQATAKPEGYDLGGNAYIGGVFGFKESAFTMTPYAGLEYAYAQVDGFTEKGSIAAMRVDGFSQDSLSARFGLGLNWTVLRENESSLRFSFDIAYARELLDLETAISARFSGDSAGRFKVNAATLSRDSVQVGPSVDFNMDETKSLNFSYRYESDFGKQTAHHVNASFRMRF